MPPKWRTLADRLAEEIRAGAYAPGDHLPSIRDLVRAGEGSKTTVLAAIRALEDEGLVVSSRGHGIVVQALPAEGPTQPHGAVRVPDAVATALGVPRGTEVPCRHQLFKEKGKPACSLTKYSHPEHVKASEPPVIDSFRETLIPREPSYEEVRALDLTHHEWVVEIIRTSFTADGSAVEVDVEVYAASKFTWTHDSPVSHE
jgi:DNA-binding GntR family transcriptional regulator